MENHPLYARIQSALDSIRPYLIADGGNVEIVGISEENELKLSLVGNCKSCNMSTMTFRAGVEEGQVGGRNQPKYPPVIYDAYWNFIWWPSKRT